MAAVTVPNKLGGLARVVIHQKLLSEDEAITIQTATNNKQHSFISQLLQSCRFTALKIAQACFHAFGYPLLLLNMLNQDFLPGKDISPQLMQSYRAITLYNRGDNMFVGVSAAPNLHILNEIQFQTGKTLMPMIVENDKLRKWIDKLVEASDS